MAVCVVGHLMLARVCVRRQEEHAPFSPVKPMSACILRRRKVRGREFVGGGVRFLCVRYLVRMLELGGSEWEGFAAGEGADDKGSPRCTVSDREDVPFRGRDERRAGRERET